MKQKNISIVSELKDKLSRAKSLILTDYRGLTHKQLEELHKSVKTVGGEYMIVKNSLLKIAGAKTEASTGPTAVLFSYDDELAPLKILAKFVKNFSLPTYKMAFIGELNYDAAQTEKLAKLPSKLELQAQVVSMLNANIQKLAYVLGVIKDVRKS